MRAKGRYVLTFFVVFSLVGAQLATAETIVNETRHVLANMTAGWIYEATSSETIYISLRVHDGEYINLSVFDTHNYNAWKDGFAYTSIIEDGYITSLDTEFQASDGISYYIMLDNRDKTYPVDVDIIVQDIPLSQEEINAQIVIPIVLAGIFGIGLLGTIVIILRRRAKKHPSYTTVKTLTTRTNLAEPKFLSLAQDDVRFCVQCGSENSISENYCSYCGHRMTQHQ